MRYFLFGFLFFSSTLFAQRDSTINGIKCHLIADSDTGTCWIQKNVKTKKAAYFSGHYFEVFRDGKLKAKGFYKRGKRSNKWVFYYENGQKSVEGYYDEGLKSNLWMEYYMNGQLSWKGNFFKDMRSGFWRYYYENGVQKAMTRYLIKSSVVKGEKVKKSKGSSLKPNVEIHYTISPCDSLVEYYPNGKLKVRILYGKEGGLNGTCDYYYENGSKNFEGAFANGKKIGTWNYFCADGSLFYNIVFDASEVGNRSAVNDKIDTKCNYVEVKPEMKWEVEFIPPVQ